MLSGRYIFADWRAHSGTLFMAIPTWNDSEGWTMEPLVLSENLLQGVFVLGLGKDAEGELYVLTSDGVAPTATGGQIFKLVPGGG